MCVFAYIYFKLVHVRVCLYFCSSVYMCVYAYIFGGEGHSTPPPQSIFSPPVEIL